MRFAYAPGNPQRASSGEARNIFPIWNASAFVARDVYEHGCFADFGTDLGGHSGAYFDNLAYSVVDGRLEARHSRLTFAAIVVFGYLLGSCPWGYWLIRVFKGEDIRKVGSGNIGIANVVRSYSRWFAVPLVLLDVGEGLRPGAARRRLRVAALRRAGRRRSDARPLAAVLPALREGGKMVATGGGCVPRLAPLVALTGARHLARRLRALRLRLCRLGQHGALHADRRLGLSDRPVRDRLRPGGSGRDGLAAPREPEPAAQAPSTSGGWRSFRGSASHVPERRSLAIRDASGTTLIAASP